MTPRELQRQLPGPTCPTIAPVVDYLRGQGREDLVLVCNAYMVECSQLRSVAKKAIRELGKITPPA